MRREFTNPRTLATENQKDLLCSMVNASFDRANRFRIYSYNHKKPLSENCCAYLIEHLDTITAMDVSRLFDSCKAGCSQSNYTRYTSMVHSIQWDYFNDTPFAYYNGYHD